MSTLRVTSVRGRTSGTSPTLPDGAAITGVNVVGGGLTVTGVSTFFSNVGIGTENADKVFVVKGIGGNYVGEFHNTQDALSNNGVYIRVENTAAATQALNVNGQLIVNGAGEVTVGSAFSVSQAGVCTAAEFHGDGSNLTNLPAAGITTEAGTASGIVTHVRLSSAQDHKITATGFTTITSSGSGTEGASHTIRIVNSGIATVGFSTYFLFPSGSAPSLPTADGAISLISFTVHDSVGAGCTQLLAGASVNYS